MAATKTVAERLREKPRYADVTCYIAKNIAGIECGKESSCGECGYKAVNTLADMIEAEQAELRAENERLRRDFYEPCARMGFTEHAHGIEAMCDAMSRVAQGHECRVDFKALDLLCDKLECGDANHRATAAQIRKAMNGVERSNDGVDVDALKFCADYLDKIGHGDIADTIRAAFEGETYELFKQAPQLPEGIEWPRFEDGELVKFGDEVDGIEGKIGTITLYTHGFVLNGLYYHKGEPAMRPEPEVLDADGVPIKVGDTVWYTDYDGETLERTVERFDRISSHPKIRVYFTNKNWMPPNELTHRKPDTQEAIESDIIERWRDGVCPQEPPFTRDKCRDLCTCNSCLAERIMETCDRQRKLLGGE